MMETSIDILCAMRNVSSSLSRLWCEFIMCRRKIFITHQLLP